MTRKTHPKLRKILTLVSCAVLLVCISVVGTLAYLTSVTGEVKNTFTYGKVGITLDEYKTDEYGVADTTADRVQANDYKLIPGHTYVKDPTVHVDTDSEYAWLFVKVVDEIAAIEDVKTIATQMQEKGWSLVAGATNVFAYKDIVSAGDDVVVFDNFKLRGDADVAAYAGKAITIQAYAIQADGFDSAAAAWAAAPTTWPTPAPTAATPEEPANP